MIDPKFNELPDESPKVATVVTSNTETLAPKSSQPNKGLSINDTIAGDTLLSTGGTGVDTSGVRAGSGAGAGGVSLTPQERSSPAPVLEGDARGTSSLGSVGHADTGLPGTGATEIAAVSEDTYAPSYDEVAVRAYLLWVERGSPHGSSEADWELAHEQIVMERRVTPRSMSATA